MSGIGAIGGAGAIGAGVGAATSAVSAGPSSSLTASSQANATQTKTQADPSTVVKISDAAMKAMSEPTQPGASFSVSSDASGHHYVNGIDANGFRNPELQQYQQISAMSNSSSMQDGSYSPLVAATLLALMEKHK